MSGESHLQVLRCSVRANLTQAITGKHVATTSACSESLAGSRARRDRQNPQESQYGGSQQSRCGPVFRCAGEFRRNRFAQSPYGVYASQIAEYRLIERFQNAEVPIGTVGMPKFVVRLECSSGSVGIAKLGRLPGLSS